MENNEPTWGEKLSEWQRLARIGWMHMSVEQFKDVLQALNELLARDAQWQQKWMAAVDSRDTAYNDGFRDAQSHENRGRAHRA